MKNIEIEKIDEIIKYLESNPKVLCDPYPCYDSCIFELLNSLGIEKDYMTKYDKLIDKDIKDMKLKDLKVMYTFILRGERFCTGYIESEIDNGNLLKLAKREKELISRRWF